MDAQRTRLLATLDDVVRQVAGVERCHLVAEDSLFAGLGLNSMQVFKVIVRLEKALDISIGSDPEDFERLRSLDGLLTLLVEKLASGAGSAA